MDHPLVEADLFPSSSRCNFRNLPPIEVMRQNPSFWFSLVIGTGSLDVRAKQAFVNPDGKPGKRPLRNSQGGLRLDESYIHKEYITLFRTDAVTLQTVIQTATIEERPPDPDGERGGEKGAGPGAGFSAKARAGDRGGGRSDAGADGSGRDGPAAGIAPGAGSRAKTKAKAHAKKS